MDVRRAGLRNGQERRAELHGDGARVEHAADPGTVVEPARPDHRQIGHAPDVGEEGQEGHQLAPARRTGVVDVDATVPASLAALDDQPVDAALGRRDRLVRGRDRGQDRRPGPAAQLVDERTLRRAEGEGDRGRLLTEQHVDLGREVVVVPARFAERDAVVVRPRLQRFGVRGDGRRVGGLRSRQEQVRRPRAVSRSAQFADPAGERLGVEVPGGQRPETPGCRHRDEQLGARRTARHRCGPDRQARSAPGGEGERADHAMTIVRDAPPPPGDARRPANGSARPAERAALPFARRLVPNYSTEPDTRPSRPDDHADAAGSRPAAGAGPATSCPARRRRAASAPTSARSPSRGRGRAGARGPRVPGRRPAPGSRGRRR